MIYLETNNMEQQFIITDSESTVQGWIARGWLVVSVTPMHVATGSSFVQHGKLAIVLEKFTGESAAKKAPR